MPGWSCSSPVVQVLAAAVEHPLAQELTDGARVGVVAVGGHLLRGVADHLQGAGEEATPARGYPGLHVPALAEHGIHQGAVGISGPVQGAPHTMYFDVGLVRVPLRAGLALPPCPQPLRQQGCDESFPGRVPACGWRHMAEGEAPPQEQLGQLAQARRVAQPPQDDQEHDVGGHAQIVEGGAGPLVEAVRAGRAAEGPVAQARPLRLLLGPGRLAVWAGQGTSPLRSTPRG